MTSYKSIQLFTCRNYSHVCPLQQNTRACERHNLEVHQSGCADCYCQNKVGFDFTIAWWCVPMVCHKENDPVLPVSKLKLAAILMQWSSMQATKGTSHMCKHYTKQLFLFPRGLGMRLEEQYNPQYKLQTTTIPVVLPLHIRQILDHCGASLSNQHTVGQIMQWYTDPCM